MPDVNKSALRGGERLQVSRIDDGDSVSREIFDVEGKDACHIVPMHPCDQMSIVSLLAQDVSVADQSLPTTINIKIVRQEGSHALNVAKPPCSFGGCKP